MARGKIMDGTYIIWLDILGFEKLASEIAKKVYFSDLFLTPLLMTKLNWTLISERT